MKRLNLIIKIKSGGSWRKAQAVTTYWYTSIVPMNCIEDGGCSDEGFSEMHSLCQKGKGTNYQRIRNGDTNLDNNI